MVDGSDGLDKSDGVPGSDMRTNSYSEYGSGGKYTSSDVPATFRQGRISPDGYRCRKCNKAVDDCICKIGWEFPSVIVNWGRLGKIILIGLCILIPTLIIGSIFF